MDYEIQYHTEHFRTYLVGKEAMDTTDAIPCLLSLLKASTCRDNVLSIMRIVHRSTISVNGPQIKDMIT